MGEGKWKKCGEEERREGCGRRGVEGRGMGGREGERRIRNSVELTFKEKPYRKALSPSPSSLSVLFFRSQEFVQSIVNALVCLMSSAKCRN